MNEARFYISVFVMVAIFLAGVSPACAFISGGKSFIQICGADGEAQSVEVDAALDPFAQETPAQDPARHLETFEKCPFCFSQTHQKYGSVSSVVISFNVLPRYVFVGAGSAIPDTQNLRVFEARGPPVFS